MPSNAEELLEVLDLEQIEVDLFRAPAQETVLPRVFGGQVAAQALVAAARTTDASYVVHSLHSYFLQPGDTKAPIIYDVENLRDGRSFATRRVLARQRGRPVFALTADFQRPEDGPVHQAAMPDVPPPDACVDPRELLGRQASGMGFSEWDVVDFRFVPPLEGETTGQGPGRQRIWIKVSSPMPADPFLHVAAFTYASDMTLMGAALAPHGKIITDRTLLIASLDHAVWFHQPFRVDEWWLYDQVSPAAYGARGLVTADVFTAGGTLVASVAQEGLLRPREERP